MFKLLELLSEVLTACYQAAFLVGAGFFGGLGVLLLGNRLYWRIRGTRVMGAVAGVRETARSTYYPVYRYVLPDGTSAEVTSDTGTSSTSGMETGRTVRLLVLRKHPDRAVDADSRAAEVMGAICLAFAAIFACIALIVWPITALTWIMSLGVAIHWASRLHKSVPRPGGGSSGSPLVGRVRPQNLREVPVRPIEEILSRKSAEAQRARQKTARIVTPILVTVGIAVLALGVHLGRTVSHLESSGAREPGTVIGLEEEPTLHSRTYYPLVRFRSRNGELVQFRDGTGSNPPSYHEGDTVTVLYLPAAPERSAMIDRGRWNWLGPVALCLFGTVLALVALRARLGRSAAPAAGAPYPAAKISPARRRR